jgi:hypothetical protein
MKIRNFGSEIIADGIADLGFERTLVGLSNPKSEIILTPKSRMNPYGAYFTEQP